MHSDHGTDAHGHGHGEAAGHGTLRGYLIGFVLSIILTAVPFWLVMTGALHSLPATAMAIFAFAVVQIIVHVVFFLHLDTKVEGGWTLVAFVFTVVIVGIVIGGTIWVMYHLNANMMPSMSPGSTEMTMG